MSEISGHIKSLWRYPVKSMQGEKRNTLTLNLRGVEWDRLFTIRDLDGKFGSGKNTRRFVRIDGLLSFEAHYEQDIPVITFPNGRILRGDESNIHTALSEALGQPVTLAREEVISHLDDSPIHIVTTASLTWLQNALPNSVIDEKRLRANLIVDIEGDTPIEHTWIGQQLLVGDHVVLEITKLAERCVMTSSEQKDLPHDPRVFRHIAQHANLKLGVYAKVIAGSVINLSDKISISS